MKAPFLVILPSCAFASLQKQQDHLSSLQSQLDSQLAHYQRVIDFLSQNNAHNEQVMPTENIYEIMEETTSKLATLIDRTKSIMRRVGEYNKHSLNQVKINERIDNVLIEELKRRERFAEWKSKHLSDENTTSFVEYMPLSELQSLFDHETFITPSENELTKSILEYTKQSLIEMEYNMSISVSDLLSQSDDKFSTQFEAILSNYNKDASGSCATIPQCVQMIEGELKNHYYGVNNVDYASYENGGSVFYPLTSVAYQPQPRNNMQQNLEDAVIERMWFEQQAFLMDDHDRGMTRFLKRIMEWRKKNDPREWYMQYKLGKLRRFLPQDWERTIDWLYGRFVGESWDNYTPRGLIDAIVPDYMYQSLGFGEFAQTTGPEVAITSGNKRVDIGESTKHIGQCYPLSMNQDDDPALSYLNRLSTLDDDDATNSSLLLGPKYTVRLSGPIYIDAVSLEHRSFPIPKVDSSVGLKGGESAPRHFRVIGFPPCRDGDDDDCTARGFDLAQTIDLGSFEYVRVTVTDAEDDHGDFQSNDDKITSSKKRGRSRSIKTFEVKGGKWKIHSELEDNSVDPVFSSDAKQMQCSPDDLECKAKRINIKSIDTEIDPISKALLAQGGGGGGECMPNYDDKDAVPSCGEDDYSDATAIFTRHNRHETRNLVAAVSFIIDENWGNPDYTCLYRVRVHGDPLEV